MAERRTDDGDITDPSRPHHNPDQREDKRNRVERDRDSAIDQAEERSRADRIRPQTPRDVG